MFPQLVTISSHKNQEAYFKKMQTEYDIPASHIYRFIPEKKEFPISYIREIQHTIIPTSSHNRLFILHNFYTASLEAQNALLKLLEEATDKNVFLLMVRSADDVLPTLQSRCIVIKDTQILPEKTKTGFSKNDIPLLQFETGPMSREEALKRIQESIQYISINIVSYPQLVTFLKRAIRTVTLIEQNNISPQLAVDTLTITLQQLLASKEKKL